MIFSHNRSVVMPPEVLQVLQDEKPPAKVGGQLIRTLAKLLDLYEDELQFVRHNLAGHRLSQQILVLDSSSSSYLKFRTPRKYTPLFLHAGDLVPLRLLALLHYRKRRVEQCPQKPCGKMVLNLFHP